MLLINKIRVLTRKLRRYQKVDREVSAAGWKLNSIMLVFQIILIILFSFFSQKKEGAAGSRGVEEHVEQHLEERVAQPVEQPVEERVEEAGPSRAVFKGTGRGATMRHLVLPHSIGKWKKYIVCVLRFYFNVKLLQMFSIL